LGLAGANYSSTGNKKWIKVMTKVGSSIESKYYPFIMQPVGLASWLLVSMQKINNE